VAGDTKVDLDEVGSLCECRSCAHRWRFPELAGIGAGLRATLGLTASTEDFGGEQNRVTFERFVPLNELLADIDLVVTRGGTGITLGTLAHGVPLAIILLAADQLRRPAGQIAGSASVLAQPSFAANARKIAGMPGPMRLGGPMRLADHCGDSVSRVSVYGLLPPAQQAVAVQCQLAAVRPQATQLAERVAARDLLIVTTLLHSQDLEQI
jgi:hypothetical protein